MRIQALKPADTKTPGLWEPVVGVFVLGIIITLIIFNCGCVWTGGSYTAPDGTLVKGNRAAFLYPFKLGDAKLTAPAPAGATAGAFSISGYETDGGAAGVVQIMDKAGNVIGVMAKDAVLP